MKEIKKAAQNWPIAVGMFILFLIMLLRINDIFILELTVWGEVLLSNGLGFIFILIYVLLADKSLHDIGFHTEDFGLNLMLGLSLFLGIYLIAYGLEYLLLSTTGTNPVLVIKAVTSQAGDNPGFWFAIALIVGNAVTALLEEELFRGLLISKLLTSFSFWAANILQAVLFGLWHLVWPIKELVTGQLPGQAVVFTGSMLLIVTTLNGFIWGYIYLKTNSLWGSWMGNLVTGSVLDLVHIKSEFGLDTLVTVRGTIAIILGIISMLLINYLADEFKLEEAGAW